MFAVDFGWGYLSVGGWRLLLLLHRFHLGPLRRRISAMLQLSEGLTWGRSASSHLIWFHHGEIEVATSSYSYSLHSTIPALL